MKYEILGIYGVDDAILGLSLSYNVALDKARLAAEKLIKINTDNLNELNVNSGELKFLEFIKVSLDMTAPRYFWQQFDTYRIGITKQSESTMHTIMKNKLTQDNFENEIDGAILDILNDSISQKDFMKVKTNLPESFLQRRIISTDLKTLIHIYKQRKNHRLKEWKDFANFLQDFIFNNIQFQFLSK